MSVLDDYAWPADYPKGVPPETTTPADGVAYRAVSKFPPDEDDFRMTREDNPQGEYESKELRIKSYGVSFFGKQAVLEDKIRRYPALENKLIAKGTLVDALGVISKQSRHSHFTLWKCANSKPHEHINEPTGNPA